jgi:polyisoprenoid-binding protein YceI
MKKIMFSSLVLASIALFSFAPKAVKKEVTTFTVDAAKSKVEFTGSKTSDFHTGYFPVKSGSVKVDGGKLVGGSFVVNVAGLKVTDAAGDKLQGHLSSADFLDVAKFGEATFTITNVTYTKGDRATVTGDLSLHGVKAPITFTAYVRSTDAAKGFFAEAFFPLDRTVFGVSYGVGMVDTDVQLAVHLYASK